MVQSLRAFYNIRFCRLQSLIHFFQSCFALLEIGGFLVEIVYFLSNRLGFVSQGFEHLDSSLAVHREDYFGLQICHICFCVVLVFRM